MKRKDWFTFADPEAVRAEYLNGPQDLDEIQPGIWGIRGIGTICLGDREHMRKIQAKRFYDKFHAGPCRLGNWDIPALPSVATRLGY